MEMVSIVFFEDHNAITKQRTRLVDNEQPYAHRARMLALRANLHRAEELDEVVCVKEWTLQNTTIGAVMSHGRRRQSGVWRWWLDGMVELTSEKSKIQAEPQTNPLTLVQAHPRAGHQLAPVCGALVQVLRISSGGRLELAGG